MENLTSLADEQNWTDEEATKWTIKLVFCTFYLFLFLFGTVGNGCVIIMLINIFTQMQRNANPSKRVNQSGTNNVFIYVLGLSVVDFLVIMHLPLLIFEILEGQWVFGLVMCKLYWIGESVNKLLSSFLMTVLSWDRFLAVCAPITSFRYRTNTVAMAVLASCTMVATLLLYPVLKESTVRSVDKTTMALNQDPDGDYDPANTIQKCVFETNTPVFMLYTLAFGYLMPALLISYFYLRVILRLRAKTKEVGLDGCGSASQRLHKVTKRIVTVVLFYFFCWTPYWLLNIMLQFQFIITSWSGLTLSSVFFAAHLLVCFNSAANPLLYALINRELRQQHAQALQKRRRSNQTQILRPLAEKQSLTQSLPSYNNTVRRHTTILERPRGDSLNKKMLLMWSGTEQRRSLSQGTLKLSLSGIRSLLTSNHVPCDKPANGVPHMDDLIRSSCSQPSLSTAASSVHREESLLLIAEVARADPVDAKPSDAFL